MDEPQAPVTYVLTELSRDKRPWTLALHPDRWVFESAGVAPKTITRDKLRTWVDVETFAGFGLLNVTLETKVSLKTTPEQKAALLAWIGPPTPQDLRLALDKRFSVVSLITGALLLLVATPWFMPSWLLPPGDVDKVSFDFLLGAWGASSVLAYLGSRIVTHRALFLFDVVAQLAVAAWWAYEIAAGERSWWM
ncbi:MAG: hypothetical protein H0V17_04925, partial [Deltaproteobacteria bacterium]|nr:hypothetical protein [Deltaproteobacteria bacterium]